LYVTLTIKEKTRLRKRMMAGICARILALGALMALGLSKIFRSSLGIFRKKNDVYPVILSKRLPNMN